MNMNKIVLLATVLFGIAIAGCTPFKDNFSCENYKGAGNSCMPIEDNIDYAVNKGGDNNTVQKSTGATDNNDANNLGDYDKDSYQKLQEDYYVAKNMLKEYNNLLQKADGSLSVLTPYERERLKRLKEKEAEFKNIIRKYKNSIKKKNKMADLLSTYDIKIQNQQESPVVAKPKVLKVTILPYKDSNGSFHMMNHIYEILDKPRFIMGKYTYNKPKNKYQKTEKTGQTKKNDNKTAKRENIEKEQNQKLTALEKEYNEKLRQVRQLSKDKAEDNKTPRKMKRSKYGSLTKDRILLRPIPDYGKSEVTVLLNMKGVLVKIEKVLNDGEWYKIKTGQYKGWVASEFIEEKQPDNIKDKNIPVGTENTENIYPTNTSGEKNPVKKENTSSTESTEKPKNNISSKSDIKKNKQASDMGFVKHTQGFKENRADDNSSQQDKGNTEQIKSGERDKGDNPAQQKWDLDKIRKMMKEKSGIQ